MSIIKHNFTATIIAILNSNNDGKGKELLKINELIQYLNIKTKAANRGSKSRAGFANHYAIYVLIEDYLNGGIDFVMKPLGRFFQVTETVDAGKYFLDIDKVQRYPITFVVKTDESSEEIIDKITHGAITRKAISWQERDDDN